MVDEGGASISTCLMTVACVDKATNRAVAWPAEARAPFFAEGSE